MLASSTVTTSGQACVRVAASYRAATMATWVISLSLLAYPLLGTLIAFTSFSSLLASVPVRVVILVLCFVMIAKTNGVVWASGKAMLFFSLWFLYFVRLMWDMFVVGIPVAGEFAFKFVAFSIPMAMAMMHAPLIDERKLTRQLLALGVLTCMLAIVANYTDLAGSRSFTEAAEGRLFLETVNPITFGHIGVTTLLAALSMTRYCVRMVEWVGVAAAAALGFVVIFLAASRGPMLSLLVCIVVAILCVKRYRWLLLPMIAGSLLILSELSSYSQSQLASRVTASVQSDSPEIRVVMAAGALQQFLDSPLIGSAIVERQYKDFPHNPFIEAAMAIGIGGLMLLSLINFNALTCIIRALLQGDLLVPLLAVQALVAAQVSGSMSESATMWMFLALFASARRRKHRYAIGSG